MLMVEVDNDMSWVVFIDFILVGVCIMGDGDGCDLSIVSLGENEECMVCCLIYVECIFSVYCVYYVMFFKGCFIIDYMLCLNNVGNFVLLLMWVEVMYVLDVFGEVLNGWVMVGD